MKQSQYFNIPAARIVKKTPREWLTTKPKTRDTWDHVKWERTENGTDFQLTYSTSEFQEMRGSIVLGSGLLFFFCFDEVVVDHEKRELRFVEYKFVSHKETLPKWRYREAQRQVALYASLLHLSNNERALYTAKFFKIGKRLKIPRPWLINYSQRHQVVFGSCADDMSFYEMTSCNYKEVVDFYLYKAEVVKSGNLKLAGIWDELYYRRESDYLEDSFDFVPVQQDFEVKKELMHICYGS